MNPEDLTSLLHQFKNGNHTLDETVSRLSSMQAETMTDACIDHQRLWRTGIPEVIYGASKSAQQITTIARAMLQRKGPVLATRVSKEKARLITQELPELQYHDNSQILIGNAVKPSPDTYRGKTVVVSAGTSDIPVAEEARLTLQAFGHPVEKLYDVGVAGLHRILGQKQLLREASAVIVVAGMEGALPTVVAGLISAPVIAVPTSVGYGASFGGIAALLGMLNSCAPGVAVVNIDNGFGAACMADAINRC
ncbi:nickel pincer cofactor biosynthesis protein LarB [Desulforhopalus sp. 52FAK]